MKNASFQSLITPTMFRTAVSAVKTLAGYDPQNVTYMYICPSTAIKLGHTLRKCSNIGKGQALERSNKAMVENARGFEEMCEMEWSEEVSHGARKVLYERKRNASKRLPLTEDTTKMVVFLKTEIESNKKRLLGSEMEVPRIWRELCELILSYLIIFNRRRQGEVSKIKLDDFCKARCGGGDSDINRCLSKMEQQLCRLFYRLEIVGKRGRTVPLLMDGGLFEVVQLLNRKRQEAGVAAANTYLFVYISFIIFVICGQCQLLDLDFVDLER